MALSSFDQTSWDYGFLCGLTGTGMVNGRTVPGSPAAAAHETLSRDQSNRGLNRDSFVIGYLVGAKVRETRIPILQDMRREDLLKMAGKVVYLTTSDDYQILVGDSVIRIRME